LDLRGGDNAVQVKNSTPLRSTFGFGDHQSADFTIAFWMKGRPKAGGVCGLVTRGVTRKGNHGLGVSATGGGTDVAFKYGKATISGRDDTLGDAGWHHVAAVVDVKARQSRLYVDGSLAASRSIGADGTYYNRDQQKDARHIVFGADQMETGTPITAFARAPLDEIRIYSRALSEDEVVSLLGAGQ